MTFALTRTSVDGAIDGAAAAPSSLATPSSIDGTSRSTVRADSVRIGSRTDVDGTSGFLTNADVIARPFFDGQEGLASDAAALFLVVCWRISAIDTHTLGCIAAIGAKKSVQFRNK